MSIEGFFAHYKPENFAAEIKKRADYEYPSSIQSVGRMMASEGRLGVLKLAHRYQRIEPIHPLVLMEKAATDDKKSLNYNLSAIFFGVNLGAIERMLYEREFDQVEYFAEADLYLAGTPFTFAHNPGVTRTVPEDTWRRMIEVAGKDRTLASFFDREISALPSSFQKYVANPGDLPGLFSVTQDVIVPSYRDRMRELVKPAA